MMRSLFSAVSGLRNHQTRMDVIGNNIANVNTVGYKKSKVNFQDMLSQNISGASSPQSGRGGTNPRQIGLGMTIGGIDTVWTQGASESTGNATDMMIDGDGFFIVGTGSQKYYTRAGNFSFDANGNLVTSSGMKVQGWMVDSNGNIDTTQPLDGISIPQGQAIEPKETTKAEYQNNLNSETKVGDTYPITVEVHDSLGNTYTVNLNLKKTAANTWDVVVPTDSSNNPIYPTGISAITVNNPTITFDSSGNYSTPASTDTNQVNLDITYDPTANIGNDGSTNVTLDFSNLTQYQSESNVEMNTQDGNSSGTLSGYSIDSSGVITGEFSNGQTKKLAQVALANFNNPAGLSKAGENLYQVSNNSGQPQVGTAGSGGRGQIASSTLEMSNVDLSQEFTDMIITERGFQANSRIITTSDEMLQELVNLKR